MENAKVKSKEAFNNQAATYDLDVKGQHARNLYPVLVDKLSSLNYEKILDLGCGTGAVLKLITDKIKYAHAYGLDISENMLKQAEQKLNDKAMLTLGDAEHLPFENDFFDVVYCNDSFHHYPSPDAALSEVQQVLKQNGTFIVCDSWMPFFFRNIMNTFIKFSKEGDVHIYSENEICSLLSRYFHNVEWQRISDTGFMACAIK